MHAVTREKEKFLERKYQHQSFLNYLQIQDLSHSLIDKSKSTWKNALRQALQAESKKEMDKAIEVANKAVGIRVRSEKLINIGQNLGL
jgi:hypothetical protein